MDMTNVDADTMIHFGVIGRGQLDAQAFGSMLDHTDDLSYREEVEGVKLQFVHAMNQLQTKRTGDRRRALDLILKRLDCQDEGKLEELMELCENHDCNAAKLFEVVEEEFNDQYEPGGALRWRYERDGYLIEDCLSTDLMILRSPYFTYAPACSPCVPNAGHLEGAGELCRKIEQMGPATLFGRVINCATADCLITYCLDATFFPGGKAPYPVFSVEAGLIIEPPL